jgi:hypothetical protein
MSDKEAFFAKLSETHKDIDVITAKMESDEKQFGTKQRFGYFSIPYSASCGDRYYSQGRKKIYRTENKKVITEPRGIYTKPSKTGVDSFFTNDFKQDLNLLNKVAEMAKKEREEYLNKVRSDKQEKNNLVRFKPTGPQEYKDFYDKNPVEYKIPITKEIDKKLKIDKEHKSVFMENRGIYTKPPKKGSSTTPGVLFGYFKDDPQLISMKEKWNEQDVKNRKRSKSANEDEGVPKPSFKPAALKKNETFQKDKEIYGEDANKIRDLVEKATEVFNLFILSRLVKMEKKDKNMKKSYRKQHLINKLLLNLHLLPNLYINYNII